MERKLLESIEVNPQILAGKPVIKGTRLSVELILRMLSQGISGKEILEEYPHLIQLTNGSEKYFLDQAYLTKAKVLVLECMILGILLQFTLWYQCVNKDLICITHFQYKICY